MRPPDGDERAAILSLHGRYAYAITSRDAETWVSCFVADGRFSPTVGHGAGRAVEGHAALRRFADGLFAADAVAVLTRPLDLVVFDDDDAEGRCHGLVLRRCTAGPRWDLMGSVVYRDRLARTASGWQFAERRPVRDR